MANKNFHIGLFDMALFYFCSENGLMNVVMGSWGCCGTKSICIWVQTPLSSHLGCYSCYCWWSVNWDKRETYNISILCFITRHHGDVLTLRNEYLLPQWCAALLGVMKPVQWFITSISWPAFYPAAYWCYASCLNLVQNFI